MSRLSLRGVVVPRSEPYIHIRRSNESWIASGTSDLVIAHDHRPDASRPDRSVFSQWTWNGTTLQASNDRYGFVPLYYFKREGEIGVSPSLGQLLALGAPADLDYDAIAVFLRLGCFLDCDTAFRSIRALPASASFVWKEGKLTLRGGFQIVEPENVSRRAALERYIALFRQAILRRSPDTTEFAVPLSGGRDSRHILLELCAAGHYPKYCVTAGRLPPGNTGQGEITVASEVARRLGIAHAVVEQPPAMRMTERRNNAETNFCAPDTSWMLAVADFLKDKVSVVYDGIGGDVLSAGLFLTRERLDNFRSGQLIRVAEDLLGPPHALSRMFAREIQSKLSRGAAIQRLIIELEKHQSAANPVASFIFWNRTRRHIASSPYRLLARVGTVMAPYLDHDVFDLLASLPSEFFLDHTFHTEAIAFAFPSFAAVPYTPREARDGSADHSALLQRFVFEALQTIAAHGRSSLIRRSFFVPRLLRCLVDRRYLPAVGWMARYIFYFLQLENASQRKEVLI